MTQGKSDDPKPAPLRGAVSRLTMHRNLGALRHRALLLAMQGQHARAARMVLDELAVTPEQVPTLGPEVRRLVSLAASYLEKAGDHGRAADLFVALGEEERAAESRSFHVPPGSRGGSARPTGPTDPEGDGPPTRRGPVEPRTDLTPVRSRPSSRAPARRSSPAAAHRPDAAAPRRSAVLAGAEVLVAEGRRSVAAEQLAQNGLFYEAGVCLIKAGDADAALLHLVRVPHDDPQYAAAARTAVRVLCRSGSCLPQHVRFLRDWIDAGPAGEEQASLFLRFAELLASCADLHTEELVLRSVLRRLPGHPAATERLARLAASAGTSHTVSVPGPGSAAADDAPAPASVVLAELTPGAIVAERFRIDEEIGRGGMATVYSAHDLELDEQVALKVFAGQLLGTSWQQEAMERFRFELKLCRKLRHPNIIQVYDIGLFAGHRYFTMELLRGYSLDRLLGEPVQTAWGIECLVQAATGLHAAHQEGVVHRDVKPENLFVTEDGIVKVMDFGIAKSSYQPGRTQVGTLAGTPEYMAPEQINNFSLVGPAADQYSLGCVAYQMFTGHVPFASDQLMTLLMAHIEREPTPLRDLNPEVPPDVEAVVLRMLRKKPEERFSTTWEAAEALANLRD